MPPSDSSNRPAWTGVAGSNSTPPITPSPLRASWKCNASRVVPPSQFQGSSEGQSDAAASGSVRGRLNREKSRDCLTGVASPCPTGSRPAGDADAVGESVGRELPNVWRNTSTNRSRSAPGQRSPTPSSNWTALSLPVTASSAKRRMCGDSSLT